MREIKFRAWHENSMCDIVVIDQWYNTIKCGFSLNRHRGLMTFNEDSVLIQYTGLEDKNGKEIYFDSDIVEYTYEDSEQNEYTVKGVITLDLKFTCSIIVKDKHDRIYGVTKSDFNNIEIIGNIYENKDLL